MKTTFTLTIIGTLICSYLMAQDGPNVRYIEPDKLDSSFVGKYCHIDFGEDSFGGRVIDTIQVDVNGQPMKFYEHREDNGYGNWFSEQYLIRVENENQFSTHLEDSRIDSLTVEKIYVTSTLSYYIGESPIDTITVFQHSYDKKNISKVIIKN